MDVDTCRERVWALAREQELDDPSWIVELDEFDEPPLWTRFADAAFLQGIPREQRGVLALEVALELLRMHARHAAADAPGRSYLMYVTLFVGDYAQPDVLVPAPCIYVDPKHPRRLPPGVGYGEPISDLGRATAGWLARLGPAFDEFWVAEDEPPPRDPDTARVYVGWKKDPVPNVRSTGSYRGSNDRASG